VTKELGHLHRPTHSRSFMPTILHLVASLGRRAPRCPTLRGFTLNMTRDAKDLHGRR
jgi:hypothetical protein